MVLLDQAVRLCQSSPTWGPQVGEIESTIEDTIGLDVVDYTERHDLVKETAIWLFSEVSLINFYLIFVFLTNSLIQ